MAVAGVRILSVADVGRVIRDRRRALGMTQGVVASITGIPQPNISTIERGRGSPEIETCLRLLSALGVDLIAAGR